MSAPLDLTGRPLYPGRVRAQVFTLALGLAACADTGAELDAVGRYAVRGVASGVPPEGLRLRLRAPLGEQALSIEEDGSFGFEGALAAGVSFTIVVEAPAAYLCGLSPAQGVMPDRDLQVDLRCTRRQLDDCPTFDETPWWTALSDAPSEVAHVDVLPDGRVLVVGAVYDGARPTPALWWQGPSGAEAPRQRRLEGAPPVTPTAALVLEDRLYVVGHREVGDQVDGFLFALDLDGRLDPSFGAAGVLELTADPEVDCDNPGGSLRTVVDVAPAGEDGLWVGGAWATPCQVTRPWVTRVSRREARERSSIYDPAVRFLWPVGNPRFDSLPRLEAVLPSGDGGALWVGRFWAAERWQAGLRKLDSNGEVDAAFGQDGVLGLGGPEAPRVGFARTEAKDAARLPDGRVLTVGERTLFNQASALYEGSAGMLWRSGAGGEPATQEHLQVPRWPGQPRSEDALYAVARGDDRVWAAGLQDTEAGASLVVLELDAGAPVPSAPEPMLWRFTPEVSGAWTSPPRIAAGEDGCVWWAAAHDERAWLGALRRP